ncbi:branched-chain amino acid ABC transporter substrate-binding protein [Paraburkholderia sp. RL17-337-BIB-A]|uniref:branched-chain amino acid ABC transporter substrate-binding protein n=1 Tax=Paraburkholderia sp. RL17-337-BIB-A TaxID=3031636 RepID=UPI0038B8EAD1
MNVFLRRLGKFSSVILLATTPLLGHAQVKIGFAAGLTGDSSHYGVDLERGAKIAIDEANSSHLKINGKPVTFELVVEDDQSDPRMGTIVAQRLVDEGVVGVVGHFNSGTTLPASAIYHSAGIPMVSPTASNPTLTSQGFNNVFRLVNSDAQLGAYAARYAVQNMHAMHIGTLDDRTAFGQGLADAFSKAVVAAGGTVADREFTADQSEDFRAQITAMKAKGVDVVFFAGLDKQAGELSKQIHQLNLKATILGGGSFANDNFLSLAGPTGEGTVSWEPGVALSMMPGGAGFDAKMKSRYHAGVLAYSPNAYDAVWTLIHAMQKANSTEPKVYLPAVVQTSFAGVSGPISFMPNGDLKDPPATLYKVINGKWVPQMIARNGQMHPLGQ